MIQFPIDIINENAHINVRNPNILAIYIEANKFSKSIDCLQTEHCMEYVLSGSNTVRNASVTQKISTKEFLFRKKGNYQLELSEDYKGLLFFFENDFINYFLEKHNISIKKEIFPSEFQSFHFKSLKFTDEQCQEVLTIIQKHRRFAPCMVELSFHQILLHIASHEPTRTFIDFLKYTASHYKIDLSFYMEENFTKNLSLSQMAEKTGRSVSSFKKDFQNTFGQTPFRWILNRRLDYAQ